MPQQSKHSTADEIGRCFLAADHRENAVGDDFFFCQMGAIRSRACKSMYEPLAGMRLLPVYGGAEVGRHLLDTFEHASDAVGIVLKVAKNFGKIQRPFLQQLVIFDRHAEHLRGHNGRHERRQILDDIGGSLGDKTVNESVDDVLNMGAQNGDARRHKGARAKAPQARMIGRIAKKHLPLHYPDDGIQRRETHAGQLFLCKRAIG